MSETIEIETPETNRRLILAVLAFGVFVAADDLTVVSTMLRQMIFDLGLSIPADLDRAAWIVNVYLIAYVGVMPFIGRLSDIIGRRRVYLSALLLFLLGSIWVPLAHTLPAFLSGRVLTALGGGALVPVSMAIIGDLYPRERRAGALGVLGAVDTAGWVWGPLYGALLIRLLSWRWQFYLNIPLSLIGLAAAWLALRRLPEPHRPIRLDWWGAGLLTGGLLALNIALLGSGDVQTAGGFVDYQTAGRLNLPLLYALAALLLTLFLLWQRHLGSQAGNHEKAVLPLIDLRLLRRRNFAVALLLNFFIGSILIIAMVNVPLLINILEMDVAAAALRSGQLLSLMTGAMACLAWVGGRLTGKFHYRPITLLGLLACALGFGLMGSTWQADTSAWRMAWQLAILGVGFGLVIAPIGAAAINAAPGDQHGIASGLVIVLRLIGMSVGLSALTAWGLERFNFLRDRLVLPPLTDAAYTQSLIQGLTQTTVTILTETFLISAGVAGLAWLISFQLRPDAP